MRVQDTIERAVRLVPEKVALCHGDHTWTYRQLRDESERRAGVLIEAGLGVGDRLVVAERVGGEQVLDYLACMRVGVIFCGLSALLTPPELAALTTRLAPRLACTTSGLPHPGLPAPLTLPLSLPGTPTAAALREAARRSAAVGADDPCDIRPTSGTVGGRPKLVVIAHRTHAGRCSTEAWATPSEEVFASLATASLQMGAICRVFAVGGTVVLPGSVGVYGLEAELARQGVTNLALTPALLGALVGQDQPPPANLRLLRIQTQGAAVPRELAAAVAARYGAYLMVRYGMTECVGIVATPATGAPPGSVGRPHEDATIRIVDGAGGEVPQGEVGELIVRSPFVMLGYFDDPAATAAILRDGWLYTGDTVRQDAEGFYYLVGRRALQINVGSMKVAPEEVEAVLLRHPGVREVVVVPHPDRTRGEVVKAIVVPEGPPPEVAALRRFCRAALAGYKVPRVIVFREEPLPRSERGKVLRQQV
ncbi:MAG TPA: AMP-binding protein [Thermomicrobiales bacterium]|jgi:long-chain acyl-CoA synthetase